MEWIQRPVSASAMKIPFCDLEHIIPPLRSLTGMSFVPHTTMYKRITLESY